MIRQNPRTRAVRGFFVYPYHSAVEQEQEYRCTTCGGRLVWGRVLTTDRVPTDGIWRHETEPEDEHLPTVPWADE